MPHRFDLALFTQLNEEYSDKRIVKQPRSPDPTFQASDGQRRGEVIEKAFRTSGKRVLEVGCGRANISRYLATTYDCEVVGFDAKPYKEWEQPFPPNLTVTTGDVSDDTLDIGKFDIIYSFDVWEHVAHPFTALANCFDWLNPGGRMYLHAQLHRGPRASHRYREVFFPWPHLLFTPEVFEEFYVSIGMKPTRPSWVNKLTYTQYLDHFDRIGYRVHSCRGAAGEFDEEFYQRFHDALSAYPRWDLAHDGFVAVLERPGDLDQNRSMTSGEDQGLRKTRLESEIAALEAQLSRLRGRKSLRAADWVGRQARRLRGG